MTNLPQATSSNKETVTVPYMCALLQRALSKMTQPELLHSYIIKDRLIEAMKPEELTATEIVALDKWIGYVFVDSDKVDCTLVLQRCMSLKHMDI